MNKTHIVAHIWIPFAFEVSLTPAEWSLAEVVLSGWSGSYPTFKLLVGAERLRLMGPGPPPGALEALGELGPEAQRYARLLERRLVHLSPNASSRRISNAITQKFGASRLEALICEPVEGPEPARPGKVDPWLIRDEFLRLKRDTVTLVSFLNRYGAWSPYARPRLREVVAIFPDGIWSDQDRFRNALTQGPRLWFGQQPNAPLGPFRQPGAGLGPFLSGSKFPYFTQTVRTCTEAIAMSITVDFLRRERFRKCARKDCQKPYKVESRHKRRYCTQYCAHLASVRSIRKKRKKEE